MRCTVVNISNVQGHPINTSHTQNVHSRILLVPYCAYHCTCRNNENSVHRPELLYCNLFCDNNYCAVQ